MNPSAPRFIKPALNPGFKSNTTAINGNSAVVPTKPQGQQTVATPNPQPQARGFVNVFNNPTSSILSPKAFHIPKAKTQDLRYRAKHKGPPALTSPIKQEKQQLPLALTTDPAPLVQMDPIQDEPDSSSVPRNIAKSSWAKTPDYRSNFDKLPKHDPLNKLVSPPHQSVPPGRGKVPVKRSSVGEGEYRNLPMGVLQTTVKRRGKEKVIEFPLVTDAHVPPPEVDEENAKTWVFPTNISMRDYQYSIIEHGLFENSLVVLPTGLGKTFIAGVIMYNYYRWFPEGKIIFMAPTKPLVAQQVGAVQGYVGFPEEDVLMLTGSTHTASHRGNAWNSKRIFYITPQILKSDIDQGRCPVESIVLMVIDEAHKAQGNYSYCTVVRQVAQRTPHFRILALTATPGGTVDAIQKVISSLLITRMEVREEEDVDVQKYIQNKTIQIVKVSLSGPFSRARDLFCKVAKIPLDELCNANVFYNRDPSQVKQGQIFHASQKFDENKPVGDQTPQYYFIKSLFGAATSLYHAYNLLLNYGISSFRNFIEDFMGKELKQNASIFHKKLVRRPEMKELRDFLLEINDSTTGINHPKIQRMQEILLDHFNENADTRVIIFVELRDVVTQIVDTLQNFEPLIKATPFIGQRGSKGAGKGLTQKEQQRIITQFKEGEFNCLVATSIGEEGLDIGEVDLIVCYDAKASPIRMIQRMGRTGRKRKGRCVFLVTENGEDAVFDRFQNKKDKMNRAMISNQKNFTFFSHNPQMLPTGVHPKVVLQELVIEKIDGIGTSKKRPRSNPDRGESTGVHLKNRASDDSDEPPKKKKKGAAKNGWDMLPEEVDYLQANDFIQSTSDMDEIPDDPVREISTQHLARFDNPFLDADDEQNENLQDADTEGEDGSDEPQIRSVQSRPTSGVGHSLRTYAIRDCIRFAKRLQEDETLIYEYESHMDMDIAMSDVEFVKTAGKSKKVIPNQKPKSTNLTQWIKPDDADPTVDKIDTTGEENGSGKPAIAVPKSGRNRMAQFKLHLGGEGENDSLATRLPQPTTSGTKVQTPNCNARPRVSQAVLMHHRSTSSDELQDEFDFPVDDKQPEPIENSDEEIHQDTASEHYDLVIPLDEETTCDEDGNDEPEIVFTNPNLSPPMSMRDEPGPTLPAASEKSFDWDVFSTEKPNTDTACGTNNLTPRVVDATVDLQFDFSAFNDFFDNASKLYDCPNPLQSRPSTNANTTTKDTNKLTTTSTTANTISVMTTNPASNPVSAHIIATNTSSFSKKPLNTIANTKPNAITITKNTNSNTMHAITTNTNSIAKQPSVDHPKTPNTATTTGTALNTAASPLPAQEIDEDDPELSFNFDSPPSKLLNRLKRKDTTSSEKAPSVQKMSHDQAVAKLKNMLKKRVTTEKPALEFLDIAAEVSANCSSDLDSDQDDADAPNDSIVLPSDEEGNVPPATDDDFALWHRSLSSQANVRPQNFDTPKLAYRRKFALSYSKNTPKPNFPLDRSCDINNPLIDDENGADESDLNDSFIVPDDQIVDPSSPALSRDDGGKDHVATLGNDDDIVMDDDVITLDHLVDANTPNKKGTSSHTISHDQIHKYGSPDCQAVEDDIEDDDDKPLPKTIYPDILIDDAVDETLDPSLAFSLDAPVSDEKVLSAAFSSESAVSIIVHDSEDTDPRDDPASLSAAKTLNQQVRNILESSKYPVSLIPVAKRGWKQEAPFSARAEYIISGHPAGESIFVVSQKQLQSIDLKRTTSWLEKKKTSQMGTLLPFLIVEDPNIGNSMQSPVDSDGHVICVLQNSVKLLWSSCPSETAEIIAHIAHTQSKQHGPLALPADVHQASQFLEQNKKQLDVLLSVPDMTEAVALALLRAVPSLHHVIHTPYSELRKASPELTSAELSGMCNYWKLDLAGRITEASGGTKPTT